MSHFTVLVIGANYAAQLAPFHEYECTGEDDQYVQNVDETPELLEDYNTGTRRMVKLPEGVVVFGAATDPSYLIHPKLGTLLNYSHNSLYQPDPSGEKQFGGGVEACRTEYHDQEFIKTLNAAKQADMKANPDHSWHFLEHDEYLKKTREEYATAQGLKAGMSYAIVKDSQWYQRGEMGWFGMSSDEVSEEEWNEQFAKLINDLPADTLLTMVDCHI